MSQTEISVVLAELDNDLRRIILDYLRRDTVSYSSLNAIPTGNAYQAVDLRGEITNGFRLSDPDIYAGFDLNGRTFVDLGCNLGERTRLAAKAGASFAEGIEYEEFFVRIAGLINVYNGVHNVSIHRGDITKADCLTHNFDVGASFSSYAYVNESLEATLSRINDFFILETHAIDLGWIRHYVIRPSEHMQHWIIYDFSDHGADLKTQKRVCVAFARSPQPIIEVAHNRTFQVSKRVRMTADISVGESPRASMLCGQEGPGREIFQGVRLRLQALSHRDWASLGPTLDELAAELSAQAAVSEEPDFFASDLYWVSFLKGLKDFKSSHVLSPDNPYLLYLKQLSDAGLYDPDLKPELADEALLHARMTARFEAFTTALETQSHPNPIMIYNAFSVERLDANGLSVDHKPEDQFFYDGRGHRYWTPAIDGHHRIAALFMSGATSSRSAFAWSNLYPTDFRRSDGTEGGTDWASSAVLDAAEETITDLFGD